MPYDLAAFVISSAFKPARAKSRLACSTCLKKSPEHFQAARSSTVQIAQLHIGKLPFCIKAYFLECQSAS